MLHLQVIAVGGVPDASAVEFAEGVRDELRISSLLELEAASGD